LSARSAPRAVVPFRRRLISLYDSTFSRAV
jgi:hypothetical protein